MAFQLNPSKLPIWQSENTLKLGTDETSQQLESVTTAQERLINLLFQGIAEDQLELIGNSVGLSPDEAGELVERLRPSLLENPEYSVTTSTFDARFAEIIRIGFETNLAPEAVLANRASNLILIPKLDRTGLMLTRALAEAGFKNFVTTDYEAVGRNDLGELGFQNNQLGLPRLSALRNALEAQSSKIEISHIAKRTKPSLAVLRGMHRINPQEYRELKLAHLGIEFGINELRISGVIEPGKTSCFACRELWESELDGTWTTTSIQLSTRNDQLDDGPGLLMAASIAAKTVCRFVDSPETASTGGFRVDLRSRAVSELSWQPHPSCNCRR